MRSSCFAFLVAVLLLLPAVAAAQLQVDVDSSEFRKYPIAITSFKNIGEGEDKWGFAELSGTVMRNDLGLTGLFEVLDPKGFLEDPAKAGIDAGSIDFTNWLQVGADGLLKGGYTISDSEITVEMHVFDVALAREMLTKKYTVQRKDARALIHRLANDVMEFFTLKRSIFSTKIVTVRQINRIKQIYVMDFDGENGYVLVDNANLNLLPSWNPNGKEIYFTSYIANNPDLYRIGLTRGSKLMKVSSYRGLNVGADVSPDGSKIALTLSKDGNSEIYSINSGGSNGRRLTNAWGIDSSPSWAPDNTRLAFVSDRSGSPQIYMMDSASGATTRLTFQGTYNQSPNWSPDSDKICFSGRDEMMGYDLFIVDAATREITRLTQDQGRNEDCAWSPDGRHIVFSSDRTGEYKLWIMTADGKTQKQISYQPGSFSTPDWSPMFQEVGGE